VSDGELTGPTLPGSQLGHDLCRLRLLFRGNQNLPCETANGLVGGPAVERLGAAIPVGNSPPQIGGDKRLSDRLEQMRLKSALLFRPLRSVMSRSGLTATSTSTLRPLLWIMAVSWLFTIL
jgi:hypothetical protein